MSSGGVIVPQHLLPDALRPVAKVAILIGHFVHGLAAAAAPPGQGAPPEKNRRGRPAKGQVGLVQPQGQWGGQARCAEQQIALMQNDVSLKAIPRAHAVCLVKEVLSDLVSKRNQEIDPAQPDAELLPNFRVTSAALNVIHDVLEAHATQLMVSAGIMSQHANRLTVTPKDFKVLDTLKQADKSGCLSAAPASKPRCPQKKRTKGEVTGPSLSLAADQPMKFISQSAARLTRRNEPAQLAARVKVRGQSKAL